MGRKFSDNALTTLAGSITNLSTTLTVAAGKGSNFPALTGKGVAGSALDYAIITLENSSGAREKIRVEERSVDTLGTAGFPLVRGYDGTVAQSWNAGDSVDLRWERAGVQDHEDKALAGASGRAWGNKDSTTTGLTYGYYGSIEQVDGVPTTLADGTVALTLSQTNYVERTPAGAVSANTTGFSTDKIPMAQVVTGATNISSITDKRPANLPPFGLVSFSIAGGAGSQTATADQARAYIIELTGVLTGNRDLVLPNVKRPWIIYNGTSGAFSITAKVAGQPGTVITQGKHMGIYGNGTDVVPAGDDLADNAVTTSKITDGAVTSAKLASGLLTVPVRQTVRLAALDASGYSALLSAGAALNFNVDASPTAAVLDFAAGTSDFTATLTADASNQGTLIASNTNYITADYVSASSVTWGSYLIPPQYGYAFDRTQAALLNFEAADASTTMIDDFGNTWTASGNAQIDTAQFKFGTSSLLLDGTGDYVTSTNFTTLGDGSWEMSAWFRLNATSAQHVVFFASNAGGFGAYLDVDHNAGSRRVRLALSSNGTSTDITGGVVSGATVLSLATWYKVRLVFDALAGNYKVYLSNAGGAEVAELTQASTARICAVTMLRIGGDSAGTNGFNGWIDGFRFIRAATVTGTETPSASAFTIASQPVHFFSIPAMKMYSATVASASAGTDPTLTAVNRLFVGEADTGAATVSAVRNYALRGCATVRQAATIATNTTYSFNHNVGTALISFMAYYVCATTASGYTPGERVPIADVLYTDVGGEYGVGRSIQRNSCRLMTRSNGIGVIRPVAGGAGVTMNGAMWNLEGTIQRSF